MTECTTSKKQLKKGAVAGLQHCVAAELRVHRVFMLFADSYNFDVNRNQKPLYALDSADKGALIFTDHTGTVCFGTTVFLCALCGRCHTAQMHLLWLCASLQSSIQYMIYKFILFQT